MKITNYLAQNKDYFYIMHLSWGKNYRREELWDFARRKGIIGLDHPDVPGDWAKVKNKVNNRLSNQWVKQFDMFCENMCPKSIDNDDIVVMMAGWDHVMGVGKVIGPHRYDTVYRSREEFFNHVRPVEWLLEYDYGRIKQIPCIYFNNTLARIEKKGSKCWPVLSNIDLGEEIAQTASLKNTQSDADKLKGLVDIQTKLTKETTQVNRYKRSRELVEQMKQLYSYQCQLCSPKTTSIPQIPMRNGNNYVEVHHIKGFNEINNIEGQYDQDQADYVIDNYKNTAVVCVYHHKLLHRHKDKFEYDYNQKCFVSNDKTTKIPLILNKHL